MKEMEQLMKKENNNNQSKNIQEEQLPEEQLPEEQKEFKCAHCHKGMILGNIKRMDCGHDYCEECIRTMMQNANTRLMCEYKNPTTSKVCGEALNNDTLRRIDNKIFEEYCNKSTN
jgi:late competence protein required for DNA uptake (superfamily II DNA/RNA helicase)